MTLGFLKILPCLDEKFDLVYIDGDHTYDATRKDWEMTKDIYNKFLLFDERLSSLKSLYFINNSLIVLDNNDLLKAYNLINNEIFWKVD